MLWSASFFDLNPAFGCGGSGLPGIGTAASAGVFDFDRVKVVCTVSREPRFGFFTGKIRAYAL